MAIIGFISAFCLFLDNIDVILDKKVSKRYKVIRTLCIMFVMVAMLSYYFITI